MSALQNENKTSVQMSDYERVTIIYFGNDWFAENRTSSHHIARALASRFHIVYVECPGLRAPQGSRRDVRRIFSKMWRFLFRAESGHRNVTLLTLPQIPLHRSPMIRRVNHWLSAVTLRFYLFRKGLRNRLTWFVAPHMGHMCGTLGERASVYYCVDDFAAFPRMDALAIQKIDDDLTRKASVVFVAAEALMNRKKELNTRVYHSPHGVDVEHFARAADGDGGLPEELRDQKRPVIGYFGLIESWIDLELVDFLARQRPEYSFVMIGHVGVGEEKLPRLPNITFLGRRPYEDLPEYGRGFDCCIIPYRLTRQVLNANPLKLREYLAMGKRVVSVRTPAIEEFSDVVSIADGKDEFLEKLDEAVQVPVLLDERKQRMQRVFDMSWTSRTDAVWQILSNEIATSSSHLCEVSPAVAPRQ